MSELGGVWRTVGGRRIFIKDGQNLDDAMRESGKFPNLNKQTDYQGKEFDKTPSTGKTADIVINEVRKWKEQGKNSKVIEWNKEAIEVLEKIEGKPNAKIKIYRATVGDEINDGDWVFIDRKNAENWTKTPFGSPKAGVKVIEMETEAKNVEWTGKNLEFAYREPKNSKALKEKSK